MKVTRNEPPRPFVPVTIVLETQDEVDMLHAWTNNAIISPDDQPLHDLFDELYPFATEDNKFIADLTKRLKDHHKQSA